MRGMAFLMVPLTYQMPCAVFCYWSAANMFSLSQTLMLKIPGMRDFLDIPLPPKPPPPKLGEATTQDMMANPIKSMMAKARGEELKKTPVAEDLADTVSSPRAGGFDHEKHVKVRWWSSMAPDACCLLLTLALIFCQVKVLSQKPKTKKNSDE